MLEIMFEIILNYRNALAVEKTILPLGIEYVRKSFNK